MTLRSRPSGTLLPADRCIGRMDDVRKNAYRFLLYHALVEIRMVGWHAHGPLCLLNPFALRRDLLRVCDVADWLHNLARFAADDFRQFDEARFWRECDALGMGAGALGEYRSVFERELVRRPPSG